jgi:aryl-alcohol dehydrogenase-like predicted oxidoreductase
MPLQFGLLTGKFDKEFYFEKNDHRQKRITEEIVSATNNALASVWALCKKYGCTKTQLALSYILSHDEVSVVIPGIRTVQHVTDNTTGIFRIESSDMKMLEGKEEQLNGVMEMIKKQG